MGTCFCWHYKNVQNSEDLDIDLLSSIYESTSSNVYINTQRHYKPSSRTYCKHVNIYIT